ncbi:thiosulfate sulfurtransferase [Thalassobacillus devorans]|uniref:Thiosulfate sulfurtransferase n=1 Tax=Thalassobacillus devorans TaxID=279813 RepID=A0ABQ1P2L4_9BACI|nr:sulfurtransferase [Thalassobacillus devorans]NIK28250.1 thiosulfate/3-mercaptopyruvate sulfurtransferase [Thalassobacillus devorans]GGC87702.1 thiosulfate sulfurtransferase [Thalassobacillus devorans]
MSNIIAVEKAKEWSETNKVVFADCRFDLNNPEQGWHKYKQEHIPEAVYFDLEKDLSGETKTHGGRHPLPDINSLQKKLAERGIDKDTIVIAYDQNRSVMAARMLWLMKFCGYERVYILNGGLDAWKIAGYPVDANSATAEPVIEGTIHPRHDMACGESYVRTKTDEGDTIVIDSRSYARYAGWEEPIDKKKGHIPGALQYDWSGVYKEDGLWKTKEELKEHFRNLENKKEIIVYCGSGVTAASNVIGLWEAGFVNVKLYVGSFSDWISYQGNEVATISK